MKFEELIISQGFKPTSFHKIAGIDRQVIYNYRKGKAVPNAANITRITVALGVSAEKVLECFR